MGMIDFWAGRADGLWPTSKMARLKAPEGVSHVQVLSGAHLVVPNDRILELDEFDAKPLLARRLDAGVRAVSRRCLLFRPARPHEALARAKQRPSSSEFNEC